MSLSVAIPSKNEQFLNETIRDVLKNATGEVKVYPILDGYEPEELVIDPRVEYIRLPKTEYTKKRHGINKMVDMCDSEYIMSLDAHCLVAKGFDEQLAKDHQPNWVQIPRRHRLDADKWEIQTQSDSRPPIDYEYTMWPLKFDPKGLHGFKWDSRTIERKDIPIDETMHFQGSCWFMTKKWYKERGFMRIDGYSGWGQEAEEIALETYKNGGKVMTNKNTYYAHLHKGAKYGRMYYMTRQSMRDCNNYSFNFWVNENRDFFEAYIEKWNPPGWPKDWKEKLWTR